MTVAIGFTWFNGGRRALVDGSIVWGTTPVKCALLSTTWVPDAAAASWSAISSNEVTGTGYVAGGALVDAWLETDVNGYVHGGASPLTWADLTASSLRYAVVYAPGSGKLIGYITLAATAFDAVGVDLTINWSSAGVWAIGAGA